MKQKCHGKRFMTALLFLLLTGVWLLAGNHSAKAAQDNPEEALTFSQESGCYDSAFSLSISGEGVQKILYTLDGSEPTETNPSAKTYTGSLTIQDQKGTQPILTTRENVSNFSPDASFASVPAANRLDRATIVRAVGVNADGTKTKISTRTYFINNNIASSYQNCAVISLVTDKSNLLDSEKGIYVLGSQYETTWDIEDANFMQHGKEWERAASMEFFDGNGSMAIRRGVGIRVHGGYSRRNLQKSLNIYFRNEYDYGTKSLKGYELIPNATKIYDNQMGMCDNTLVTDFSNVMLRNGGNDVDYTKFQDIFIQNMVTDRAFTTQGARPCMLYLNGEYWGLYNLTEKYSDRYLQEKFDVDKSNVIAYKELELDEGTDPDGAALNELMSLGNLDMTKQANYNKFLALVDEKSFIDYYATEIYINNNDWWSGCNAKTPNNNIMFWKVADPSLENADNPYADGKWRYMLYDTEWSMGLYGSTQAGAEYDSLKYHAMGLPDPDFMDDWERTEPNGSPVFTAVLKNDTFRKKFVNTLLDIRNWNFEPNRCAKVLDEYAAIYDPLMDKHRERWGQKNVSGRVRELNNFLQERPNYVLRMLEDDIDELNQSERVNVTLSNNVRIKDSVHINTIMPDTSGGWKGVYYKNYPITLKAESKTGHEFTGWRVTDGTTREYKDSEITLTLNSSTVQIQAMFTGDAEEEPAPEEATLNSNQYYVAEFEIPFAGSKSVNDVVGAEVQINDCGKDVRYGTLNMFAQSSPYDSGAEFGQLVLSEDQSDTVISDGKLTIRKTDADIQTDGVIEDAWNRASFVNLNIFQQLDEGEQHCQAKAKFLWKADKLYVLVYVKDSDLCFNKNGYESDSIEIFYDNDGTNSVTYDDDMFQYRILHNGKTEAGKGYSDTFHVSADAKIYNGLSTNGYVVEYKVPFKNGKQTGDKVSFELQIADAISEAETRIGKLNLFADNSPYSNRSEFGTVILADSYQNQNGLSSATKQMYGIKTDTPIVIDGKIDEAWQKASPYTIDKYSLPKTAHGTTYPQSIAATARVMWDADNLYVLIMVTDNDLKQNFSYSDSDCVELFFDEDTAATDYVTAFQYRTAFDGTTEDGRNYTESGYEVVAASQITKREIPATPSPSPTPVPTTPPETEPFVGTFEVTHATITTYRRQDYADSSNAFTGQTQAQARDSVTGEPDTSGDGQINFTVVPEAGYVIDSVTAVPLRNYKNLKGPDETGKENTYRITKIKGNITITVSLVPSEPQPTETQTPAVPTATPEATPPSGNNNSDNNNSDNNNSDNNNAADTSVTAGALTYRIAGTTARVISPKKKTIGTVTIPASIKVNGTKYKITGILRNAFKNCKKLKKVTIGANVTSIGKNAFYGCKKLKTIKIKTKKLKTVAKKAFGKNAANMKVYLPKAKAKKYRKLLRGKGLPKATKYF